MLLHRFSAVIIATTLTGSVWAITPVYVSSDAGADTNDGTTTATAVQTLTKAVELVDADGTIYAAAGAYTDILVLTKPITLNGANAGVSPNTGTRTAESIITTDGPMITLDTGSAGSIIDGFKFTGAANDSADGVISVFENDSVVRNNIIDGNSGHGINVNGCTNILIDDNLVQNVTGSSRSGFFLRDLLDSTIKNNTIINTVYGGMIGDGYSNLMMSDNTIQNVPQPGIQIAHSDGQVTVTRNHFSQTNSNGSTDKAAVTIYVDSTLVDVTYNTFTDNDGAFAVRDQSGAVAATVHVNFNNILNNTAPAIRNKAQGGGTLDATNNWWGTPDGPSSGDLAEPNVQFSPWLTGESDVKRWVKY